MKIAFIFILFNTSDSEVERLTKEVGEIGLTDYKLIFIDNTVSGHGYAQGVNRGLDRGMADNCDIFIVANPDISLTTFKHGSQMSFDFVLRQLLEHFDIGGFTMLQGGVKYYGGTIDKWRMSGGLQRLKPKDIFNECDFVSGSLMIIKRKVVEQLGKFDESYGMYYEDVDYCHRAKKSGMKVGVCCKYEYEHFELSAGNIAKPLMLFKSRISFFLKFASPKQLLYEGIRLPLTMIEERKLVTGFIAKSVFLKNFLSLNISSVLNKLIFFIFFLVLTRVLPPSEYGVYTLVWTHIGLFSPFLDLGTTSYGIVHGGGISEKKLSNIVSLRFAVAVGSMIAAVITAMVMRYDSQIVLYVGLTSSIMIANALSGSYLILSSLKQKVYLSSVVATVFNLIFVAILSFLIIRIGKLNTLFYATSVLYLVYVLVNYIVIRRLIPKISFIKFNLAEWWAIINKSYIFILIGLFAGLYYRIDIFILHAFKGSEVVGVYSAGYKFFDAFLFIAASYNISVTPVFARLVKENNIELLMRRVKRDILLLSVLGLLVSMGVFVVAPYVIGLLKPAYSPAIPTLRIVIFSLPFILISSVIMNVMYVMNKSHVVLFMFIGQAVVNSVLNWVFIPHYSYIASASITVISEIINSLFLLLMLRKILVSVEKSDSSIDASVMV